MNLFSIKSIKPINANVLQDMIKLTTNINQWQ